MSAANVRYRLTEGRKQDARALRLFAEHGRNPTVTETRDWGNLTRTIPGEPLLPMRDSECGTQSGYTRHKRAGETPCVACKAAKNAAERKRQKRIRENAIA